MRNEMQGVFDERLMNIMEGLVCLEDGPQMVL